MAEQAVHRRKRKVNKKRVFFALIVIIFILSLISYGLGYFIGFIFRPRNHTGVNEPVGLITSEVTTTTTTEPEDILRVCVDAGHGGKDGGSTSNISDRLEKDDNLRIALAVRDHLEAKGVQVVMTRDDDTFVSLDDRCTIGNTSDVDFFVSLHRNSSAEGSGVEIWVSKKQPLEDTKLATNIMNALDSVGIQKNRGVRFGYINSPNEDYQVNRETNVPSCLIEMGFMNSKGDNEYFDKYLQDYAEAIANATIQTWDELKEPLVTPAPAAIATDTTRTTVTTAPIQ